VSQLRVELAGGSHPKKKRKILDPVPVALLLRCLWPGYLFWEGGARPDLAELLEELCLII